MGIDFSNIYDRFASTEQPAFDTYFSYLKSISDSATECVSEIDVFLNTITDNRSFRKIQVKQNVDYKKVSRLLRNAWYTELQLSNLALTSEFAGFSLHWAQVYSYYVCYLQIRAYLVSQNQTVNPKHRTTLKHFSQELKKRSKIFPAPWNILCDKDPKNSIFINKPQAFKNNHQLSNLASENPIDNFCKFLKTTREKDIKRKCEEWK